MNRITESKNITKLPFEHHGLLEEARLNSEDGLINLEYVDFEESNKDFSFSHRIDCTFDLNVQEDTNKLIECLAPLSKEQEICFLLHICGYSNEEISKRVGISVMLTDRCIEIAIKRVINSYKYLRD